MGLGGRLEGRLGEFGEGLQSGLQRGLQTGYGRDLLSSSGKVKSKSGLVQVWFSLQTKFNSFELDSEVGRLVNILLDTYIPV